MDQQVIEKEILDLLSNGISTTLIHLPGIGRRLFENRLLDKISSHRKILLVEVKSQDVISHSQTDFFKLALINLQNQLIKSKISSELLKEIESEILKYISLQDPFSVFIGTKDVYLKVIENLDISIVVRIDGISNFIELGQPFFKSIKALRDVKERRISFLFTDGDILISESQKGVLDDLYPVVHNHIFRIPFLSKEESTQVLIQNSELFDCKLSKETKDQILKMTNGYAAFLKYSIDYISNTGLKYSNLVVSHKPMKIRFEILYQSLKESERKCILDVASDVQKKYLNEKDIDSLIMKRLLAEDGEYYSFTIPLFFYYLQKYKNNLLKTNTNSSNDNEISDDASRIQLKSGRVYINGKPIDAPLSKREFDVLRRLVENPNSVMTRDDIAKVMWGDDVANKYSDWAIDQTISRLRSKLGDSGYAPKYIKTLKGRGFTYES